MQPKHAFAMLHHDAAGATTTDGEKLLDRQDILQMFHISVRTLQYWRSKGILPYCKIGQKIFYRQTDVEEMLAKNKVIKS